MIKHRAKAITTMVQKAKLQLIELAEAGSGHYRATVQAINGQRRRFFFAATPSDPRGELNKRAELRRFANDNQVTTGSGQQ